MFDFNKPVSDLDIDINTPETPACNDSMYYLLSSSRSYNHLEFESNSLF